jgi:hypothetical protein
VNWEVGIVIGEAENTTNQNIIIELLGTWLGILMQLFLKLEAIRGDKKL